MDSEIEITREEGDSKGRYLAVVDGYEAEMTYSRLGARAIIIDHTGVPEALRGRGVGEALVLRGVEDARAEGCAGEDGVTAASRRTLRGLLLRLGLGAGGHSGPSLLDLRGTG